MAQYQLPFSFIVVSKLPRKCGQSPPPAVLGKRKRVRFKSTEGPPVDHGPRAVRPQIDGANDQFPRHDRVDDPPLSRNGREVVEGGQSSQAMVLSGGGNETTPTLMGINPRSGSITGGARIWLKVINIPATSPVFARFGTAVVATVSQLRCRSSHI